MALTNAFYEAVKEKNIRRIRIMMKDSLLVDPTFKEFNEMDKIASSITDLYVEHDGRAFEKDETNWNDDYMSAQLVQVVSNFSHERIDHLKDVVRYLRPIKSKDETHVKGSSINKNQNKHYNYREQKREDQRKGLYRGAKIATGAITGAFVGGVIASAASVTVVGGSIVGATIGGVAVTIITNRGE